jgi:hypothetical protein
MKPQAVKMLNSMTELSEMNDVRSAPSICYNNKKL